MNEFASKSYDLHFVVDGKTFFWKNPNRGVTLTDAGAKASIGWNAGSGADSRLWTDILSVTMSSGTAGKDEINNCRIQFRDGRAIVVTDAGEAGTVDHDRTPVYRQFVRDLHTRLAMAPPGTIRFSAGASETRYKVMMAIMVIAALFFVGLPIGLFFIVHEWKVLGILVAGAGFVWPFWKVVQNNRPRSYDPKYPPPELME